MKKITMIAALFVGALSFAQTPVIDRAPDATSGLISTLGDDFGVYSADYFALENETTLGELTFYGFGTGNLPIGANVDTFNVFIFGHDGAGKPAGSPIDSGAAFLALTDIDAEDFILFEEGNSIFTVDVTQANGGSSVTLPAGEYWISAYPTVFGGAAEAGRWNWQGSTTEVPFESMLIDPDDAFGAGATDWFLISTLIEDEFSSFAWTMTEGAVVSVGDNLAEQVSVFPNPTTDILNIAVPASVEVNRVSMFDVLGKNVNVSYSNGVINTSSLSKGVYILNIETNSGNLTQKIVKQ